MNDFHKLSFALADSGVSHLLSHVDNLLWAKAVLKKVPEHIVKSIVAQSRALTIYRYFAYDRRSDDAHLHDESEPIPIPTDAYCNCPVK